MHIVVVGLGRVGQSVVAALEREHHDVVAVDVRPDPVEWAEEHHDVATVRGYGASARVLQSAGCERADLLVAVTGRDETNLISALTAKQLGTKRAIARVQGEDWVDLGDVQGVALGMLGVDLVFNPRVLVARELAKIAKSQGALEVIDLADDRIEVIKLQVAEHSRLAGRSLSRVDLPREVRVGAIVRDGTLFVPGGADVLMAGDQVYLVGLPVAVNTVLDRFTDRGAAARVCVLGGGVAGETLARALVGTDTEVMVIEQQPEVAEALAIKLPHATIVCGDGTDMRLLQEHRVEGFDLFAAVTQEDEVNLLAGLLARKIGVPRIATLLHRQEYRDIYHQIGVDVVLSPRTVAAEHILRQCRQEELRSLSVLEHGAAEIVELSVPAGSRAVGVPLSRLELPRGAMVVAIIKPDRVVVAGGSDQVDAGDSVMLLTTPKTRRSVVRAFRASAF